MIMPVVLNTRRSKFHTLGNMDMTALHRIVPTGYPKHVTRGVSHHNTFLVGNTYI